MNKVLIAVAALAVTFTACEKKKSSILPPPEVDTVYIDTTKPVDTSLTIAGLSDVTATAWSEVVIPITVTRNNGLEQKVTMSVSGLPEGVKAKFSAPSGYTTFNTNLMLEIGFMEPGTHELKIMSVSDQGKSREYTIQLVIDSMTQKEVNTLFLNKVFTNNLQTIDSTDSVVNQTTAIVLNNYESRFYLTSVVLQFSPTFSEFYRSYSPSGSYHVAMDVDINTGKISIPLQLVQGRSLTNVMTDFTIEGAGEIDLENGTYSIEYVTIFDDNGTLVNNTYTLKGLLR